LARLKVCLKNEAISRQRGLITPLRRYFLKKLEQGDTPGDFEPQFSKFASLK
jgi:hypothetical protein